MKYKVWIAAPLSVFLSNAPQAEEINIIREVSKVTGPIFRAINGKAQRDFTDILKDQWNSELTTININHLGKNVVFQHQMWKVKYDTVCINYPRITDRSTCQVIAQGLFQELCQKPPVTINHELYSKHKKMYCNAGRAFTPVIANIRKAKEKQDPENQKCNMLIIKSMNNSNYINKRNIACELQKNKGN